MDKFLAYSLALLGLASCSSGQAPSAPADLVVAQELQSPLAKPIDFEPSPPVVKGIPTRKAPPLRKATADEIEELNGTLRTAGSRERLLRRIKHGRPESKDFYVALYTKAIADLPTPERSQAQLKLAQLTNSPAPQQ